MTYFQAIILGIIQGLTEFLPVSSSGHLVLFSQLFNIQEPSLVFEVIVHVGTLLAVFVVLHTEIKALIIAFWRILRNPRNANNLLKEDPACRLLIALVLGTVPAVVVALLLKKQIEQLFSSSLFVGFMLIVTGLILYSTKHQRPSSKNLEELSLRDSLLIGCGQAIAIFPGISRSGTTIATGLFRGLDREGAARFSFLLSIPAILGALVFSLGDLFRGGPSLGIGVLLAGLITAAFTGYLAMRFLLELVKRGKLIWFSYYTWFAGALVIILHLM